MQQPRRGRGGRVVVQDGKPLERIAQYPGMTTNNIAAYTAAITGLERAVQLGASNVKLFADSELPVKQITVSLK